MKSSMWNLVIEIERIESNGNIVSVRALVHLRGFARGNHAESQSTLELLFIQISFAIHISKICWN